VCLCVACGFALDFYKLFRSFQSPRVKRHGQSSGERYTQSMDTKWGEGGKGRGREPEKSQLHYEVVTVFSISRSARFALPNGA